MGPNININFKGRTVAVSLKVTNTCRRLKKHHVYYIPGYSLQMAAGIVYDGIRKKLFYIFTTPRFCLSALRWDCELLIYLSWCNNNTRKVNISLQVNYIVWYSLATVENRQVEHRDFPHTLIESNPSNRISSTRRSPSVIARCLANLDKQSWIVNIVFWKNERI